MIMTAGCVVPGIVVPGVADEITDDYTLDLQRVRDGACVGLSWSAGTCGTLRFITESTGFTAVTHFYDSETGRRLGRETVSDVPSDDQPTDFDCAARTVEETGLCADDVM